MADQRSLENLISLTNAGLSFAKFTDIRAALIDRYKQIYGSDIDLDTGTADGVFVTNLALIINNILRSMEIMYSNLDAETASGKYLDTLCALSNVIRKQATKSNAYIFVTFTGTTSTTFTADELTMVDKAGNTWKPTKSYTFTQAENTQSVYVECTNEGPIVAPKGWIYEFIDAGLPLTLSQDADANVGTDTEDDASLRARRAQSSGANGNTVIGNLIGALLNVTGIRDVKVFNNNTNAAITASDGTTIDAHSIYVVLRLLKGVTVPDETIGTLIYEKLTPGIHSCDSAGSVAKQFKYISNITSIQQAIMDQFVYWKQAVPIHPTFSVYLTPRDYFSTDEFVDIGKALFDYTSNLALDNAISSRALIMQAVYADPRFRGSVTYDIDDVVLTSAINNITFYDYTKYFVKCAGAVTQGANTYTITNGLASIAGHSFKIYNSCVIDQNTNVSYDLIDNSFEYNGLTYSVHISSYTKTGVQYVIDFE